jgi:biofilm PGA synthesis N-glycosyltransferase PgaC
MSTKYVLVTAARDEESRIEKTICSVVAQTLKPEKWIIVNDGSVDRTGEIVNEFSLKHNFIQLINKKSGNIREFGSKVRAIHEGLRSLHGMEYDFIGNIDGDVAFGPHYFECLLEKFIENEKLGIAGGWIYELQNEKYKERLGNAKHSVPGAIQMFRKECFESIGNYLSIKTGGEDCIAEVMARMNGWSTKSFPDLKVFHQRGTSTEKTNILGAHYRAGKEDYFAGYHPLFEMFKCLKRIQEKPLVVGSIFRLFGYTGGLLSKKPITIPQNIMEYLRKEQMNRIKSIINKRKIGSLP